MFLQDARLLSRRNARGTCTLAVNDRFVDFGEILWKPPGITSRGAPPKLDLQGQPRFFPGWIYLVIVYHIVAAALDRCYCYSRIRDSAILPPSGRESVGKAP
jgi:hypothetical protein